MTSAAMNGRWVIVLGDNSTPVFWSVERKSLEGVCEHIRRSCPTAHVVWQELANDAPTGGTQRKENLG